MNRRNDTGKFSIRSLAGYICKRYKWLCLAVVAGMICLSALNFLKGRNYSDSVVETDVISREEWEKAQSDLAAAENSLEAANTKLENQKILLSEYETSMSEYEAEWKADIYMRTTADNRYGVSTVYQFNGSEELSVDQALNSYRASLNNLYDDIAAKAKNEMLSAYNVQRLFTAEVILAQNQVILTTSFETQEGLAEVKELYHAWMEDRLTEYQREYPEADLSMTIAEENEYQYHDDNIFTAQRNTSNTKTSIQNNITTTSAAIVNTQNEIVTIENQIKELKKTVAEKEGLWNNTIVLSGEKLVSKTSIIIYLILGAIVGMVFGIIFFMFRYMYGRKLRDMEDMRCRIGEKVIGTLYSPTYSKNGKLVRKIDQWCGIYEITDMKQQVKRLAIDISIQLQAIRASKFMLTGTIDKTELENVGDQLKDFLESESVSIDVNENPVKNIEAAQQLKENNIVVMVEKIGVSKVEEIQRLRDYLVDSHVQILGGITV